MNTDLMKFSSSAYSTREMVQKSFDLATECILKGIEGDFVECGVAAGAQVGAMAFACQKLGVKRTFHLYDSFEGIPLAGPKDAEQPGIGKITHDKNKSLRERLVSSGITVHGEYSVRNNIKRWCLDDQNWVFHKGWFQDTLPGNKIEKICFLRLDGDLYESTQVCLQYLGDKVSKGGIILVDDYPLAGSRRAVDEWVSDRSIQFNRMPYALVTPAGRQKAKIDLRIPTPVYWYNNE